MHLLPRSIYSSFALKMGESNEESSCLFRYPKE